MGNSTSSPPAPAPMKEDSSDGVSDLPSFKPLQSQDRATTFDDREHHHSGDQQCWKNDEFKQLTRAKTFDSRLSHKKTLATVKDVLYRRHFNAKISRESNLPTFVHHQHNVRSDQQLVIVVDPMSTGSALAQKLIHRGYGVIAVISDTSVNLKELFDQVPVSLTRQFIASIFHHVSSDNALKVTLEAVKNFHIVAVFPGAETGVLLCDALSTELGLRSNGTSQSFARRNKYAMGERIRSSGLRAVKQCSAMIWDEVESFIRQDIQPLASSSFQVIVKPEESAGSEDVFLCTSLVEVQQAFGSIQGKINNLGLENTKALIQEYLDGTEYVVDTVSRDGQHKIVAIWEYDKRPANGAPFVYYGVRLRHVRGEMEHQIVAYVLKVLDALEIHHGPAHAEVKFVQGVPCLIEIGSRCHGGSGTFIPLVNACMGYNQVDVTISAYLDKLAFNEIPDMPLQLKKECIEVTLVAYDSGILRAIPGLSILQNLSSYHSCHMLFHPGQDIRPTIDMFHFPGSVLLMSDSSEVLESDVMTIRNLERSGLLEFERIHDVSQVQAMVIVDPFSTGALVAQHLCHRGLVVVCLYSNSLENIALVASLVPEGIEVTFGATIGVQETIGATAALVKKTCADLNVQLVGVISGAETGVRLTDELTNELDLRGNVFLQSNARRDKYIMGETCRRAGVRAIVQTKATTWTEVAEFILHELRPTPFRVILKPVESAGSDGVTLCLSLDACAAAFDTLLGQVNVLGQRNTAVLVQEYLDGTEYVVDTVSRDGQHKVVAIWEYDKRPVNGAAFVYFGILPVVAQDSHMVNELIAYQFTVLDALGIRNGPGHAELKYYNNEPVLIEVGARCHGGEGTWLPLANRCNGQNQVDMFIDAYIDAEKFTSYPDKPTELREYGCEAKLVCYQNGILKGIPGLEEIQSLQSYVRSEFFVRLHEPVTKTIDNVTAPGSIVLIHQDEQVLQQDLARIRELEHQGLFDIEEEQAQKCE